MFFDDAAKLFVQYGAIFEGLIGGDNLTEEQMNDNAYLNIPSYLKIGKLYAPKNYI